MEAIIAIAAVVLICCVAKSWKTRPTRTRISHSASLSHLPEQFVIVDLETTGLDPSKNEIIEIGAILVNRDSSSHLTFQALVKPRRKVPNKITQITGITQDMVDRDGASLDVALRDFREFVGDRMLVAFNADFDMAFLNNAAQRCGLTFFFNPVNCALQMARLAWPGRKSYRLASLAKDGGLSDEDSHRALGDCKRTMTVYVAASGVLGRAYP